MNEEFEVNTPDEDFIAVIPIPAAPSTPLKAAPAVSGETEGDRIARLRAQAIAAVASESDDELLARFVSEERLKAAGGSIPTDTQGFPEEYDKIEIAAPRDVHDLSYVPLGFRGYVIKAPRGVEIIIPHIFVTECLDHAIETLTIPVRNAAGAPSGVVLRNARRFPYQFNGKATSAEYKAFQTAQRAIIDRQTA